MANLLTKYLYLINMKMGGKR